MQDILFYDVETADSRLNGSICAIGWCLVRDLDVLERGETYINPGVPFSPYNTRIHGITEKDVGNAPTFTQFWSQQLGEWMQTCIVVAHNAEFDIRATEQAMFNAGIDGVQIRYVDFLPVAKRLLPDCKNHKLDTLAAWAGVNFRHHCASEDAFALFCVAKRLCEMHDFQQIPSLFRLCGVSLQNSLSNRYVPECEKAALPVSRRFANQEHFTGDVAPVSDALSSCFFCITGDVPGVDRCDAERMILERGGNCQKQVSGKTTFLVNGVFPDCAPGYQSGKTKKAYEQIEKGSILHILSPSEFLDMMRNPEQSAALRAVRDERTRRKKEAEEAAAYEKAQIHLREAEKEKACFFVPQTRAELVAYWNENVREDHDDDDALTCDPVKNGFTFFVYGKKTMELVEMKRGIVLRVCGVLKKQIEKDCDDLLDDKFYVVHADQLGALADALRVYKQQVFRTIITDTFACCSKFVDCSDARACLHPHERTFNGCYYRKNLENGIIFYGKNKNAGFEMKGD